MQASTMKSMVLLKKEVWTSETISTWNLKSGKIEKNIPPKSNEGYFSKPQNSPPSEGAVQKNFTTDEDFEEGKKNCWGTKTNKKKMEEIKQKKQNTDVKLWQKTKNLNELRRQERTKRTKKKCGLGSIIK